MSQLRTPSQVYTPNSGSSRFSDYVAKNRLVVDKTLFVKHFLECFSEISLITRPRRWGKTFNLSILEFFFSIPVDSKGLLNEAALEKKREIFSRFKIGKETQHIKTALGNYPVVFVTFKDAKGSSYEEVLRKIRLLVADAYKAHMYILESSKIDSDDKKQFQAYQKQQAPLEDLPHSLKFLMELLFQHFGRRSILLIDEYDTPFNSQFAKKILKDKGRASWKVEEESLQEVFLERSLQFFQSFLGLSLKGNENYLERSLITGILRIARSNLFSGVNNLGEFSLFNRDLFAEDFGFLEEEIGVLLDQMGFSGTEKKSEKKQKLEGAKTWFNGYEVGSWTLYNPWSIIHWIGNKFHLECYWSETSDESLLKVALREGVSATQVRALLAGQKVVVPFKSTVGLEDFHEASLNEALIWTLLASTGYLTARQQGEDQYEVRIPNYEIFKQFASLLKPQIQKGLSGLKPVEYETWIQGLAEGKVQVFCEGLQKGLRENASFYHTQKNLQAVAETFYHGLLLGLILLLKKSFLIESEAESGEGRLDLSLIGRPPGPNQPGSELGYLFELKAGQKEEDLDQLVQEGLKQIRTKDYGRKFLAHPHIQRIYEVSIAFCGKEMRFVTRLLGTTTADEIQALAGEYFCPDREEMMRRMTLAFQQAALSGNFSLSKNLSERLEKLQTLLAILKN